MNLLIYFVRSFEQKIISKMFNGSIKKIEDNMFNPHNASILNPRPVFYLTLYKHVLMNLSFRSD